MRLFLHLLLFNVLYELFVMSSSELFSFMAYKSNLNLMFIKAIVLNWKYLIHHKWLIKHPGHLYWKTSFWMGACFEWVKIKIIKRANFAQNHKIVSKIPSKIDKKLLLFLFQLSTQFELGNLIYIGFYLDLCDYEKFSMQGLVVFWTGGVLDT